MGMFDYVEVDKSIRLPGFKKGIDKKSFQTKNFDNDLTTYRITKGKKLKKEKWHYIITPKKDRPFPNATDWRKMIGSLTKIHDGWKTIKFHGVLNFYTGVLNNEEWFEYNAKFSDGKLIKITRVK